MTVLHYQMHRKYSSSKSVEQWSFSFGETTLFVQSITNRRFSQNMTLHSSIMIRNWSPFVLETDPITIASHSCTLIYPLAYGIVIQLNAHLHDILFFGNTKQMMHKPAQKTQSKVARVIIFRHTQKIFLAHASLIFYIFFISSMERNVSYLLWHWLRYQYCSQQYANP